MRLSVLISVFLCILGAALSPARAEKRLALVIGNNIYRNLSPREQLQNAVSDAEAVKAALESLHFEVDLGENLDRTALVGKLSDFGARLEAGDIALFYYAGHGVSFSGANYILPSDIPEPRVSERGEEARLADLAVAETRVVDRIRSSGARIAVVVLDACRDNPLAVRDGRSIGGERGLAPPPVAMGVLSIYSAGAGQKAMDTLGDGDPNSLFTRVFVKQLKTPGLGLREIAFKTQGEVAKLASATGYDQVPGVYSQIIGDDFFLTQPPAAPLPAPVVNLEQSDFAAAMQSGSTALLDSFLSKYPASPLVDVVRRERERLTKVANPAPVAALPPAPPTSAASLPAAVVNSEQSDFAAAMQSGSTALLDSFLSRYPASPLADVVRRERERLAKAANPAPVAALPPAAPPPGPSVPAPAVSSEQSDFGAAMQSGSIALLDSFLGKYPVGPLADIVRRERERLTPLVALPPKVDQPEPVAGDQAAWEETIASGTPEALKKFIREFPDSKRRHEAEILLANLGPAPFKPPTPQATAPPPFIRKPRPAHAEYAPIPFREPVERERERERPARPRGQGKCFAFNGERYCE